jgi:ferredoxin
MTLTVVVDRDACARSAFCVRIAPELFRLGDEDEWSVVLVDEVPPELEDAALEAEAACPTAAITVKETS